MAPPASAAACAVPTRASCPSRPIDKGWRPRDRCDEDRLVLALSASQAGEAGEYAAAAELAVRGWTVDLPRRGAAGIDLYARSPAGGRTCGIQVKAQRRVGDFDVGGLASPVDRTADEWAILVTLKPAGTRSSFYVLPRNHPYAAITAVTESFHQQGKQIKRMMLGSGLWDGYLEKWELMTHPAVEAECLLPDWVTWTLAEASRDDVFGLIPTMERPST